MSNAHNKQAAFPFRVGWFVLWCSVTLLISSFFNLSFANTLLDKKPLTLDDVSGLNRTTIYQHDTPSSLPALKNALAYAKEKNLPISIAGARHSHGGHIMTDNAVVLDMTGFNNILALNIKNQTIRVESGATWADIHEAINPHGLAIKVQQSSNIFTIGGSLSANIHGRDPRHSSLIETIRSLKLLTADGNIITLSRTQNSELFSLVIGGYGLFGVILEAEISLTRNNILRKTTQAMSCEHYLSNIAPTVLNNPEIELHFTRPSITRKSFLDDCRVISYHHYSPPTKVLRPLKEESYIWPTRQLFGLSRHYDWGKNLRWYLQDALIDKVGEESYLSRNNAMRPPIQFLRYKSEEDTDILQEYFIPLQNAATFLQEMKSVLLAENINLLSITLRLVKSESESFLPYAQQDSVGFVLYINHGKSALALEKARSWTQNLVDIALKHQGTYYLTYALYPTEEQLQKAHPTIGTFFQLKQQYDPNILFKNRFYDTYGHLTE